MNVNLHASLAPHFNLQSFANSEFWFLISFWRIFTFCNCFFIFFKTTNSFKMKKNLFLKNILFFIFYDCLPHLASKS
eukprot:UN28338